ncbi:hypothetical protein [Sorangium sp. So ce117]|uniref:hypothetical protein n=1 Tax=Sorangium sp. So ce117 TaxID=3133277 RepID=UPI003F602430
MSAAEHLWRRWQEFLLHAPASRFLDRFRFVLYPYGLWEVWRWDWSFYTAMSPHLYRPIGVAAVLGLPFPSHAVLLGVKLIATLCAAAALFNVAFRLAAFGFFASMLLLDAWHNMFGFVDARIHVVWLCGLMVLHRPGARSDAWASSASFRCMELVVVLVYFQSAVAKLMRSGWDWALEGTTMQIAMLRQGEPLGLLLARSAEISRVFSCAALLMELAFILYFPVRGARKYLLGVALLFHMGTLATLSIDFSHLWVFHAAVLMLGRELITEVRPTAEPDAGAPAAQVSRA